MRCAAAAIAVLCLARARAVAATLTGFVAFGLFAAAPAGHASRPGPTLEAYFPRSSYAPGRRARLVVLSRGQLVTVQLFHAGAESRGSRSEGIMRGDAVTEVRTLPSSHRGRRSLTVPLSRRNPSGLYFARVRDGHGGFAYAPFVLRAARGAHSRVAVVIPTNTWQAYNYRDDNRDGVPDSWYASPSVHSVSLSRPFIHHGAPPHYGPYDAAFEHWLVHTHKHADFLTDDDLETMPQATLRRRYALLVFPGHAEYATQRAYSLVEGYRNGGGNLMFLSANNFFYRVTRAGERITRTQRWRDIGRPEARWIGIQYVDWNHNQFHNAPYRVTDAHTLPWVFKGTGLHNGSRFGNYGIEIDARAASSPAGVHVLATAPNIFGAGKSAQMTYYESAGAKVFAAGAINFAGSATGPAVGRLLDNLWEHLRTR